MRDVAKVLPVIFCLSLWLPPASGQQLAAYLDNQKHFYIFDAGTSRQVEYLPVKSFQVGGDCILYVDSQNRLKMYYRGNVSMLERNAAGQYQALDYLAVYSFAGVVKVYESGEAVLLGNQVARYLAEDSLVVFYDRGQEWLAVYYRGTAVVLEDGLAGTSFDGLVAADNLVAWVSAISGNLNVFYRGNTTLVEQYFSGRNYQAGRDILAYVSGADQRFRVFYQGETKVIEEFPPAAYKAGDGIVAYIDHTGRFKVFSDGRVQEISSFGPDFFEVRNRIVLFAEQGYFKTCYKDSTYVLEHYIPTEWDASWNTIVYRDINRNLKVFTDGENRVLTYDLVESVVLYRDVIVVNKGMNNCNIYYRGIKY